MENRNIKSNDFRNVNNTISGNNITANQGGNYNQIHQETVSQSPKDSAAIKETLERLRMAVVESKELSSSEKLEALKQIDILDNAIHSPISSESESLVKRTVDSIINTVGKLPEFLDLLKTFQNFLPFLGNISFPM